MTQFSHLTLTGPYAGQTLCGAVKDPTLQHYHATYAPRFVFTDPRTCPDCLKLWNESTGEGTDND